MLASGLPDLQMTWPAEVHLICRWPDLLIREVIPDVSRGFSWHLLRFSKALPDLSPWCQRTSCMGTWTKWSSVCRKGLIVSVEVLADDYLMSTWQRKIWKRRLLCGNTASWKLTTIVVRYNSLMNVSNSEGALEAVGVWAPPFSTFFLLESALWSRKQYKEKRIWV